MLNALDKPMKARRLCVGVVLDNILKAMSLNSTINYMSNEHIKYFLQKPEQKISTNTGRWEVHLSSTELHK